MVDDKQEILNKIREQELAKNKGKASSAESINRLEARIKELEIEASREKEDLLIQLADKAEENIKSRRAEREAEQKAKIAEYKYVNQQKIEIAGLSHLVNKEEENDPQRRAKQIFVERLNARLERSRRSAETKKDNTYYI